MKGEGEEGKPSASLPLQPGQAASCIEGRERKDGLRGGLEKWRGLRGGGCYVTVSEKILTCRSKYENIEILRSPIVRRMSEQLPNNHSKTRSMVRQSSIQEVESTEAVSSAPREERRIIEISNSEEFDAILKEFQNYVNARRAMVSV